MFSFSFISRLLALLKSHYGFQHSLTHGQLKLLCHCCVPASPRSSISALGVVLISDQPRFFVHTWEQALAAEPILVPLSVLLHGVFEVRFHQGFTVSAFVYRD